MKDSLSGWKIPAPLPDPLNENEVNKYPFELLPDSLRRATVEVARFSKVPPISPAVVGLSCTATAIGKKALVVERPGLEHHPTFFFALVAQSGERKSPVFDNMIKPFEQWQKEQEKTFFDEKETAKVSNETINAIVSGLKNKAKKAQGEDVKNFVNEIKNLEAQKKREPVFPSLFTTDTTEERLFQMMHERNGAYAVMSGEGRVIFDAIMGKYSGDGRNGDAIYLAGISGDTITRDRIGGAAGPEEKIIRKPCLNVCVMVQPDKYMEAATESSLRESGALARIWPVKLPSLVGHRLEEAGEQGLNPKEMKPYYDLISTILSSQIPNQTTPCHRASLSPEAAEARRIFHNNIEQDMADGKELEDVRDIASKVVSQTVKLALVLHLADNPSLLNKRESTISKQTWDRAQKLGMFHLKEAIKIQRKTDENKTFKGAKRLLKWIAQYRLKEVTPRIVCNSGPSPRPQKAEQAKEILELLADYGYLKPEQKDDRRKPVYIVNPVWSSSKSIKSSRGVGEKVNLANISPTPDTFATFDT